MWLSPWMAAVRAAEQQRRTDEAMMMAMMYHHRPPTPSSLPPPPLPTPSHPGMQGPSGVSMSNPSPAPSPSPYWGYGHMSGPGWTPGPLPPTPGLTPNPHHYPHHVPGGKCTGPCCPYVPLSLPPPLPPPPPPPPSGPGSLSSSPAHLHPMSVPSSCTTSSSVASSLSMSHSHPQSHFLQSHGHYGPHSMGPTGPIAVSHYGNHYPSSMAPHNHHLVHHHVPPPHSVSSSSPSPSLSKSICNPLPSLPVPSTGSTASSSVASSSASVPSSGIMLPPLPPLLLPSPSSTDRLFSSVPPSSLLLAEVGRSSTPMPPTVESPYKPLILSPHSMPMSSHQPFGSNPYASHYATSLPPPHHHLSNPFLNLDPNRNLTSTPIPMHPMPIHPIPLHPSISMSEKMRPWGQSAVVGTPFGPDLSGSIPSKVNHWDQVSPSGPFIPHTMASASGVSSLSKMETSVKQERTDTRMEWEEMRSDQEKRDKKAAKKAERDKEKEIERERERERDRGREKMMYHPGFTSGSAPHSTPPSSMPSYPFHYGPLHSGSFTSSSIAASTTTTCSISSSGSVAVPSVFSLSVPPSLLHPVPVPSSPILPSPSCSSSSSSIKQRPPQPIVPTLDAIKTPKNKKKSKAITIPTVPIVPTASNGCENNINSMVDSAKLMRPWGQPTGIPPFGPELTIPPPVNHWDQVPSSGIFLHPASSTDETYVKQEENTMEWEEMRSVQERIDKKAAKKAEKDKKELEKEKERENEEKRKKEIEMQKEREKEKEKEREKEMEKVKEQERVKEKEKEKEKIREEERDKERMKMEEEMKSKKDTDLGRMIHHPESTSSSTLQSVPTSDPFCFQDVDLNTSTPMLISSSPMIPMTTCSIASSDAVVASSILPVQSVAPSLLHPPPVSSPVQSSSSSSSTSSVKRRRGSIRSGMDMIKSPKKKKTSKVTNGLSTPTNGCDENTPVVVESPKSSSVVRRRRGIRSGLDMIRNPKQKKKSKGITGSSTTSIGCEDNTNTVGDSTKSSQDGVGNEKSGEGRIGLISSQVQVPASGQASSVAGNVSETTRKLMVNKTLGETVLHRAARQGYYDVVMSCLEGNSCDINTQDNAGYTPLHECCSRGHLEIARALLLHGADANASAKGGIRVLHDAVDSDHVEVVRLLLSYGADPTISTYSGTTLVKLAHSRVMKEFLRGFLHDLNGENPTPGPVFKWNFTHDRDLEKEGMEGFDILKGVSLPSLDLCDNVTDMNLDQTSDIVNGHGGGGDDGEEFMFEMTEKPMPPTFCLKLRGNKKVLKFKYMIPTMVNSMSNQTLTQCIRMKDLLSSLSLTRTEFSSKFPQCTTIIKLTRSEFISSAQCNQLLGGSRGLFDIKSKKHPQKEELIPMDDSIREALGVETERLG